MPHSGGRVWFFHAASVNATVGIWRMSNHSCAVWIGWRPVVTTFDHRWELPIIETWWMFLGDATAIRAI
jgi:hypothetical protein